ncbi:MAG TPA: hypothetical protein VNT58_03775 [Gaiellaceae bacterium]|nr:hypothetical protein [Gaiellaceae bacterium]
MIGAAIALIVIGLILGFLIPPFGFVAAAVGVVLLLLYAIGIGRATARTMR